MKSIRNGEKNVVYCIKTKNRKIRVKTEKQACKGKKRE